MEIFGSYSKSIRLVESVWLEYLKKSTFEPDERWSVALSNRDACFLLKQAIVRVLEEALATEELDYSNWVRENGVDEEVLQELEGLRFASLRREEEPSLEELNQLSREGFLNG